MKENVIVSGGMPVNVCANTRSNICDTAKENRALLLDLGSMLNKLNDILDNGVVPTCGDVPADPNSLLDEVLFQQRVLEEMHSTVKRIFVAINGGY